MLAQSVFWRNPFQATEVMAVLQFQGHLPLLEIQRAVLDFFQGRADVVVFGAQAVNAYVVERRATEDVDVMALHGEIFAEELQGYLRERLAIAVRIRRISNRRDQAIKGYRLYQLIKEGNRHLVDVRAVAVLPPYRLFAGTVLWQLPGVRETRTYAVMEEVKSSARLALL
jgi:hypothetical protein